MVAKLGFDFCIVGDPWESPENFTDILQIIPTVVHHKGEQFTIEGLKGSGTALHTQWCFSSDYMLGDNLEKLTKQLLDIFSPKTQLIKEYLSLHPQLEAGLCFVSYST